LLEVWIFNSFACFIAGTVRYLIVFKGIEVLYEVRLKCRFMSKKGLLSMGTLLSGTCKTKDLITSLILA